jgi:hypothetical protein
MAQAEKLSRRWVASSAWPDVLRGRFKGPSCITDLPSLVGLRPRGRRLPTRLHERCQTFCLEDLRLRADDDGGGGRRCGCGDEDDDLDPCSATF